MNEMSAPNNDSNNEPKYNTKTPAVAPMTIIWNRRVTFTTPNT